MDNRIRVCISDFKKFMDFNEGERPVLSAKLGVFGKKDCFKLNELLDNRKQVSGPKYNQDQYPVIDLIFEIAIQGRLYVKANDEKGNLTLMKTPNFESYQSLNEYEKYVFLLQTYWTQYAFERKFIRWIYITAFYNLLVAIANSEEGEKIVKDEQLGTYKLYSEGAAFFHHLRFFGLGELDLNYGAKGRYEDTIKAFIPNKFGIGITTFLLTKVVQFWNREDLSLILSEVQMKASSKKNDVPFDVFKHIFSNTFVIKTINATQKNPVNGVYCFKISLTKTVWRKINLSHKHTLKDLHEAIQEAFCFCNDHLYVFYVGGNQSTGNPIYCEDAESEGATAEETAIVDLGLYKGEQILYVFDFGDDWNFNIELLRIDEEAPLPLRPMIVESKGKAPEQYGEEW